MPNPCPNTETAPAPAPAPTPDWRLATLRELATIGMDLTRDLAARAPATPPAESAAAFAKLSRAIRYTIALHDRLEHPPATQSATTQHGPAVRARLRAKQKSMQATLQAAMPKSLDPREHDTLRAEIDERLDAAYADPNFALHSAGIIILEICRDLGLTPSMLDFEREDLLIAGYYNSPPHPDPFSTATDTIWVHHPAPRPPAPD